jgi:hypothetical protein
MGAINFSADINKAIEQIAKSLGITVKEIIPHYSKRTKVEGIAYTIRGILQIVLPWLIFFVNTPDGWEPFSTICKYFVCFCFVLFGIDNVVFNVDLIKVPEAHAISEIIQELSGFVDGESE